MAPDKSRPQAAALRYDKGEERAPLLTAYGSGGRARGIVELARKHGIPIREDPDLLNLLAPLELGEEIPVEAYRAVAEILAFLYRVNR